MTTDSKAQQSGEVSCFEWQRGRKIAMTMMADAAEASFDETCIEDEFRGGRPQFNFLLRALDQLRGDENREALEGFCCVMNDLLGYFADGAYYSFSAMRRKAPRPISMTTQMPEPDRDPSGQARALIAGEAFGRSEGAKEQLQDGLGDVWVGLTEELCALRCAFSAINEVEDELQGGVPTMNKLGSGLTVMQRSIVQLERLTRELDELRPALRDLPDASQRDQEVADHG